MRFAFAGAPRFGAWVLSDLLDRGLRPALVVSQPDRPAGRGRHLSSPPVVVTARAVGVEVLQTADINAPGVATALREAGAESLVVAAFGQLLKMSLLDQLLCVNVHASLLPAYRGAAPVARALMAGECETGVCVMRMVSGLDEGPIASRTRMSIGLADNAGEIGRALALLGALGIERVFTGLADGTATWVEQTGEAGYASKLTALDRRFEPLIGAGSLHDRVRALAPDIGCDAVTKSGLRVKIWRTWPRSDPATRTERASTPSVHADTPVSSTADAGTCRVAEGRLLVTCPDGELELLAVQPAGKRVMSASEFLRGYREHAEGYIGPPPTVSKEA